MATCPCGCERRLGIFKRRLAQHAVDLRVSFPVIEHLCGFETDFPLEIRPDAEGLLSRGERMAEAMLDSAHGEHVRELPGPRQLAQFREAASLAVGLTNMSDPEWISSHLASLRRDERKLIGSMILLTKVKLATLTSGRSHEPSDPSRSGQPRPLPAVSPSAIAAKPAAGASTSRTVGDPSHGEGWWEGSEGEGHPPTSKPPAHIDAIMSPSASSSFSSGDPSLPDADEKEMRIRKAAEGGDVERMFALGLFLGRSGRAEEGEAWLRKAAACDHGDALSILGIVLERSGRVDEAVGWYRKAAEQGDVGAMFMLGALLVRSGAVWSG